MSDGAQTLAAHITSPKIDGGFRITQRNLRALIIGFVILNVSPLVRAQVATDPQKLEKPAVVSTSWAAKHLNDDAFVFIDARGELGAYLDGHLPNAVFIDMENLRGTVGGVPCMMLPPDELALRFGRLGVGNDTPVVIYANGISPEATYVSLALDRIGHTRHAIMEGGLDQWTKEHRPTTTALPAVTAAIFNPPTGPDKFTATLEDVRAMQSADNGLYLDSRSERSFKNIGHPVGAVNRPASDDLFRDNSSQWAPLGVLQSNYKQIGVDGDTPVIVGCMTGRSASQSYFTLRHVLGVENVRWFDGSFTQFSSDPTCVVEKGPDAAATTQSAE